MIEIGFGEPSYSFLTIEPLQNRSTGLQKREIISGARTLSARIMILSGISIRFQFLRTLRGIQLRISGTGSTPNLLATL